MANRGRFPFREIVDSKFKLDDLAEAFKRASERSVLRAAIVQAAPAPARDHCEHLIRAVPRRMMPQAVSSLTTMVIKWWDQPAFSAANTENHCSPSQITGRLKGASARGTRRQYCSYQGNFQSRSSQARKRSPVIQAMTKADATTTNCNNVLKPRMLACTQEMICVSRDSMKAGSRYFSTGTPVGNYLVGDQDTACGTSATSDARKHL